MIKIGFMHIPRTGGTYIESLLSQELGPNSFANFFGTPNNQNSNKISIIENISKDKNKQLKLKEIIDNPLCNSFSGHFSLNIETFLPNMHKYKYITIIRDPASRVISFVKKVTTSKTFYDYITANGKIDSKNFWFNYRDYIQRQLTIGLMPHERNGFNNYMTKCFAGINLADPFIEVDDDIYLKAINNLDKFLYIGVFEKYQEALNNILNLFNIKTNYTIRDQNKKEIPLEILEFIKQKNKYDYKLYNRITNAK